jgi:APA family basic amino acid/polyamine antiporter
VWVLRVRHPKMARPFRTPFVPLVPILGIVTAVYLMTKLPLFPTWTAMTCWMLIGLVIYFGYSVKHSKVQALTDAQEGD